jgi:hypothetical protein
MRRLVIVALLLVAGCSTTEKRPTEQTKTPKLVPVSGQVFVVTKGRENIELALTTVSAYPDSLIIEHMAKAKVRRDEYLETVKKEGEAVTAEAHRATAEITAAQEAYERIPTPSPQEYERVAENDRAWKRYKRALERAAGMKPRLEAALDRMAEASNDYSLYFTDLPTPLTSTKTDADGKFTLQLPAGQRAAFAATAGRETPGGMENYYWMVWFTPHDSTENRIMLSNDNLVSSGGLESAIHVEE